MRQAPLYQSLLEHQQSGVYATARLTESEPPPERKICRTSLNSCGMVLLTCRMLRSHVAVLQGLSGTREIASLFRDIVGDWLARNPVPVKIRTLEGPTTLRKIRVPPTYIAKLRQLAKSDRVSPLVRHILQERFSDAAS